MSESSRVNKHILNRLIEQNEYQIEELKISKLKGNCQKWIAIRRRVGVLSNKQVNETSSLEVLRSQEEEIESGYADMVFPREENKTGLK